MQHLSYSTNSLKKNVFSDLFAPNVFHSTCSGCRLKACRRMSFLCLFGLLFDQKCCNGTHGIIFIEIDNVHAHMHLPFSYRENMKAFNDFISNDLPKHLTNQNVRLYCSTPVFFVTLLKGRHAACSSLKYVFHVFHFIS